MAQEQITNGAFAASTGWTLGGQWAIAGGKLTRTPDGSGEDSAEQGSSDMAVELAVGAPYKLNFFLESISGGSLIVSVGNDIKAAISVAGEYNLQFVPADISDGLRFRASYNATIQIDNVSLKLLEYALEGADNVVVTEQEYVNNGAFGADEKWTKETSQWTISGGKLNRTPGTGDPILSGDELISNGNFDGNANGWVLNNCSYGNYQINAYVNGQALISQALGAGPDAADDIYVQGGLVTHWPSGENLFMGTSHFYVSIGGDDPGASEHILDSGNFAKTQKYGNGVLYLVAVGGTGTDYIRVGMDGPDGGGGAAGGPGLSAQVITGYSEIGADTVEQVAGDMVDALVAGRTYKLVFTVDSISGGTLTPSVAGTNGAAVTTAGTYTQYIVAGSSGGVKFTATSLLTCVIDNVSLKLIDYVSADTYNTIEVSGDSMQPNLDYNYNVICDICGFHFHIDEVRRNWKGQIVCKPGARGGAGCYEPRHPQDFARAQVDNQIEHEYVRPGPEYTFIQEAVTQDDL